MKNLCLSLILLASFSASATNFVLIDLNRPLDPDCPMHFTELDLCGAFEWPITPTSTNDVYAIFLKFWDKNDSTKTGIELDYNLDVVPWMTSMGHGSVPTIIKSVKPTAEKPEHSYFVRRIYFSMKGDWDLKFILNEKSGQKNEVSRYVYPFDLR